MALIRLIDPDGNPVLTMSEAGAEELRSRGYSDPEVADEAEELEAEEPEAGADADEADDAAEED